MVERVLPCGMPCVIVFIVDCACCVCAVFEAGGAWGEVEVVFEFS